MIRTLKGALKRIEDQAAKIADLEDQVRIGHEWGTQNANEAQRLRHLLSYRWSVNDARASCPHANREVGKISGNTYCTDCGETLNEASASPTTEGQK